jgi:hypothetical protein
MQVAELQSYFGGSMTKKVDASITYLGRVLALYFAKLGAVCRRFFLISKFLGVLFLRRKIKADLA